MKTFAANEKRSAPAVSRSQPSRFGYRGPEVKVQQAEIRAILRSTGAQAKLTVGQPNDKYEQEADRVAEQVMTMPKPAPPQGAYFGYGDEKVQTKPLVQTITPLIQRQSIEEEEEPIQSRSEIQRQPEEEEEEPIQTKPDIQKQEALEDDEEEPVMTKMNNSSSQPTSSSIKGSINQSKGQGTPLPKEPLSFMENRFGTDFSKVRIHSDSNAVQLNKQLNSQAFANGNDILFNKGKYDPNSKSGKHLLAHKLTHVIQQKGYHDGASLDRLQRKIMVAGPTTLFGVPMNSMWNVMTRWFRNTFLRKNRKRFRIYEINKYRLAKRIIEDMADTTNDLKYGDVEELLGEIRKRLAMSYLMAKSQRPRRVRGRLRYAFGYPYRGGAKKCDRRVNAAAKSYWTGPHGTQSNYWFSLNDIGKKNAYKATKKLFVRQSNPCKRTLIHCDNLISLLHFVALAESIGKVKFNKLVADGSVSIHLWHYGFEFIQKGSGRTGGKTSLKRVVLKRKSDMVIGDHVYFFNHPAYATLIQGTGNPWKLENAVLIDQKGGRDLFQGHGYSGGVTEEKMHKDMIKHFDRVVKKVDKLIKQSKSSSINKSTRALKKLDKYSGVKKVGSEYRIKGRGLMGINVDRPLKVPNAKEFPGLYNPLKPGELYPIIRPVESD